MGFEDRPTYHRFRAAVIQLFVKSGFVYDGLFDWDEAAPIHKPCPEAYLQRVAAKYQQENDRMIRPRREKVVLPRPMQAFVAARPK
jgi:hypothetical protein